MGDRILGAVLAITVVMIPVCPGRSLDQARHGLSLTCADNGTFAGLKLGERELLDAQGFSGFLVEDVACGQKQEITMGQVRRRAGDTIITAKCDTLHIRVRATIRSTGGHIAGNVRVEDLTASDRTFRASVVLALKDREWTWCKDLNTSMLALTNVRNFTSGIYGGHDQSLYPFAAIAAPDGTGLALGWPMSKPRFFTESFTKKDTGTGQFVLSVPLGLSRDAKKMPGSADFDFLIYGFNGPEHFRGAAEQYYAICPESFEVRVPRQGLWTLWVAPGMEDYADRCGVVFHEAEFDLNWWEQIPRDEKRGFMSFQYSEPWGVWHPLPIGLKDRQPAPRYKPLSQFDCPISQEAITKVVSEDLGSRKPGDRFPGVTRGYVAQAILNSAVWRDPEGNWMVYNYLPGGFFCDGERKGWDTATLIVNPDPDIRRPNRAGIAWDGQYMFADRKAAAVGSHIGGLYVDTATFQMGWDQMNYRREHWAVADLPLTYTTQPGGKVVPAQALALADSEYLKDLYNHAKRLNLPVLINGWAPIYAVCASFVDILGAGECGAIGPQPLIGQEFFGYFRALAFRKPVCIMDYSLSLYKLDATKENVETIVEPRINHYLFYGVYPGTANCWSKDNTARLDLVAPVFEKYMPIFRVINLAGWEPVRQASPENAELLLEQWGNNTTKGLYFTIHNPTDKPQTSTIRARLKALRGPAPSSIREMISDRALEITTENDWIAFPVTVAPRRTIAVQMR